MSACTAALELAADQGARLVILTVTGTGAASESEILSEARSRGVLCEAEATAGDPAEAIVRRADELDADLIVVGSRGCGAVAPDGLGSVASSVLGGSERPVLVVSPHGPRQSAKLLPMASIFETVLCAVDRSDESLEAARQAARILVPSGQLILASAIELEVAAQAGWAAASVATELESDAETALKRATEEVSAVCPCETRLIDGPTEAGILDAVEKDAATLLVLGTHGHGRIAGILIGSLTTTLLHDVSCSVLIARAGRVDDGSPSSIVVGLDGSPESAAALGAALELRDRVGGTLRQVIATGGRHVDHVAVVQDQPEIEVVDGKPVDALVEASDGADLLVVGSRGKHGMRALGSVSERVAHQARCSVLVVRHS